VTSSSRRIVADDHAAERQAGAGKGPKVPEVTLNDCLFL
jgi:hypothetical protein